MVSLCSHLAVRGRRVGIRSGHLTVGILVWWCTASAPAADVVDPVLSAWLDAHNRLLSWSATVVQTRHLAALAQPLVSTGTVYYLQPGLFRWELGQPPETIAIRSTNQLMLIYPGLRRAETYPIEPGKRSPLGDALTLMEAGFPKDEAALRRQYTISTESLTNETCRVNLAPRAAVAQRMVTQVSLVFQTNGFTLLASEIQFADGSRLENRFSRSVRNEPLPADLFSPHVPEGYSRVQPLTP